MKKAYEYFLCTIGAILFAGAINLLIVPLGLYNGGFVGIAQLIRTILSTYFGITVTSFDISGAIYFALNVPLLILAYKEMSRTFLFKTAYTVGLQTILLSIIPVLQEPVVDDMLTVCIIGGILAGLGAGLVLRAGSSGGGQDILGVYFSKKYEGFSVGKLSIAINAGVYFVCALMFDLPIVIFSLIYTVISSVVVDKVHSQNINSTVVIFTKEDGLAEYLLKEAKRGVTYWQGTGAFTGEKTNVIMILASKYELTNIKKLAMEYDKNVFITVQEDTRIFGNFEKRMDA